MDVQLPDGTILQDVPDGTTKNQIAEKLQANGRTVPREWLTGPTPEASVGKTVLHGAERGVAPMAAGLAAMGPGAEAGAAIGTAAGPIGTIVGGFVGAAGAGLAAGYAASKLQEKALQAAPEVAKMIGQDPATRAAEEKSHPYVSALSEALPQFAAFRPSFSALKTAGGLTASAANAVLGAGVDLAQQTGSDQNIDWKRVALQAGIGAAANKPTALGRKILRTPEEEVPEQPAPKAAPTPAPTKEEPGQIPLPFEAAAHAPSVEPRPPVPPGAAVSPAEEPSASFLSSEAQNVGPSSIIPRPNEPEPAITSGGVELPLEAGAAKPGLGTEEPDSGRLDVTQTGANRRDGRTKSQPTPLRPLEADQEPLSSILENKPFKGVAPKVSLEQLKEEFNKAAGQPTKLSDEDQLARDYWERREAEDAAQQPVKRQRNTGLRLEQGEPSATGGLHPDEVQRISDEATQGMKLKTRTIPTLDDAPESAEVPDKVSGKIKGFWSPSDDHIYHVAENLTSAADVRANVFHEAVHRGLNQMEFKGGLNETLAGIGRNSEVAASVKNWLNDPRNKNQEMYKDMSPQELNLRAVEEVMANYGGAQGRITSPGLAGAWNRLTAYIRGWGRDLGFKINFSNNDIVQIIRRAQDMAYTNAPAKATGGVRLQATQAPPLGQRSPQDIIKDISAGDKGEDYTEPYKKTSVVKTVKDAFTTRAGWDEQKRLWQNFKIPMKNMEEGLETGGKLDTSEGGFNAIYTASSLANSNRTNLERSLAGPAQEIRKAIKAYADKAGIGVDESLKTLHAYSLTDPNFARYNKDEYSPKEIQSLADMRAQDPHQVEINRAFDAVSKLKSMTEDLNKQAYHPGDQDPVDRTVNPLLHSITEASEAANRVGQYKTIQAARNLIMQGHVKGSLEKTVQSLGEGEEAQGTRGNKIFYHRPDGNIEVLTMDDPKMLEAMKGFNNDIGKFWRGMNAITGRLGALHTRLNPAFGPWNFVRHAMTSSMIVGAESGGYINGPMQAAHLLATITSKVADGGMVRAGRMAAAIAGKDMAQVSALAAKHPFYQAMKDYMDVGGLAGYGDNFNIKAQTLATMKDVGPSKVLRTAEQVKKVADIYNNTFELAGRTATFDFMRNKIISRLKDSGQDYSSAEAKTGINLRAAAYAKNLFNYEQFGKYGREAGSLYMFLRPSLTTAARSINALNPAFSTLKQHLSTLPESIRNDPEAIARATRDFTSKQQSARMMMPVMLGSGMMLYHMAMLGGETDEQGRNKVATDNMSTWARNIRFPIGFAHGIVGKENDYFQLPWGFGLGAFGALGAQLAGVVEGNNTLVSALGNMIPIAIDSYMPLPVPKFDPVDHPLAYIIDAVTPAFARPIIDYAMNVDEFGRNIYNESARGNAYSGGQNLPELYSTVSEYMANATNGGINVSPPTLHFFTNSYFDGIARILHDGYGIALTASGTKDFDAKRDIPILDSFIGKSSSYDTREFFDVQKQVLAKEAKLQMFKDRPDQLIDYMDKHPNDKMIVTLFNQQINGQLREVNRQIRQIRADDSVSMKEKAEVIKELTTHRDFIYRGIIDMVKDYDQ